MMGQLLSLGVTMPIYASLYLLAALTGPIPAIPVSATPRIKTLIPSILLGCVLPTLAMVLSYAFASTTTHQTLVAAWQIMPLYISFFQLLLPAILPFEGSSFTSITAGRDDLRKSLRTVYDRLRALQSTTHIASLFYTTRIILPHPSCDLANVLTPANPFVPKAIDSLNEGTLRFLQWDYVLAAASMAALVFGTTPKVKDGVRKFFMAVFEGVGTVLAVTALDREEVRWEAEDLKVAKKK